MGGTVSVDIEALRDRPLFLGLSDEQVARLAARMRRQAVSARDDVWSPERGPDGIYVIVRGRVELRPPGLAAEEEGIVAGEAGAFDEGFCDGFFGEAALIDPGASVGRAVALERCLLSVIGADDLTAVLAEEPELELGLLLNIARALSRRLRLLNEARGAEEL